jgi:hypothetical protein
MVLPNISLQFHPPHVPLTLTTHSLTRVFAAFHSLIFVQNFIMFIQSSTNSDAKNTCLLLCGRFRDSIIAQSFFFWILCLSAYLQYMCFEISSLFASDFFLSCLKFAAIQFSVLWTQRSWQVIIKEKKDSAIGLFVHSVMCVIIENVLKRGQQINWKFEWNVWRECGLNKFLKIYIFEYCIILFSSVKNW